MEFTAYSADGGNVNENININAELVTDIYDKKKALEDYKGFCRKIGGAVCLMGLNDIVVSVLLVYIMAFLGLGRLASINDTFAYGAKWLLNDVCVYLFPIVSLSLLFRKELKENYRDRSYRKMKWEGIIIFPAMLSMGTIGSYITILIADLLDSLFGTGEIPEALQNVKPEADLAQSIIYIVFVCIIGPVCEEIIFRHLLLKPMRKYGDWLAVIISAACFGAYHGNFDQFAYAAIVGVFLAVAAVRSNSLLPPILLHVINNLLVCLSDVVPKFKSDSVLPTDTDKFIDQFMFELDFILDAAFWLGLAAVVVMIVSGMFRLHNNFSIISGRKKAAILLSNPLIWVGLVMVVLIFMGITI